MFCRFHSRKKKDQKLERTKSCKQKGNEKERDEIKEKKKKFFDDSKQIPRFLNPVLLWLMIENKNKHSTFTRTFCG